MKIIKTFTGDDSKQKLRQGLEDFPSLENEVALAPKIVIMGHILLLGSAVPKSKAILAALTWITSAENLPKGKKSQVLAAKKALSVGWDGKSFQGWNHSQFVSWLPSLLLLTVGPSAVPKGPQGGISLLLVAFFPLLVVKT